MPMYAMEQRKIMIGTYEPRNPDQQFQDICDIGGMVSSTIHNLQRMYFSIKGKKDYELAFQTTNPSYDLNGFCTKLTKNQRFIIR